MDHIKVKLNALKKAMEEAPKEQPQEEQVQVQATPEEPQMIATEDLMRTIQPAIAILKELLSRADHKRVEEAELKAKQEALDFALQNAQVVQPMPEHLYVSLDGDNIGNAVMRAEQQNDEASIKEMSNKINAGQNAIIQWAMRYNGEVIEQGGDEGLVKIPGTSFDRLDELRGEYESACGATVTIGVGATIQESTQARMLGKLRGKNCTVVFDDGTEKELQLRLQQAGPQDEASKLAEAGLAAQ